MSTTDERSAAPPAEEDGDSGAWRLAAGLCAALVAITWALYAPVLGHDFISFDDPAYLTANEVVQRGLTWDGVRWAFGPEHANNFHPLTWLSHMLDVSLFGLDAGAHHAMGVSLHALSACVLLLALRALTGRLWASAFVAAVFALHPLHVESVAWASERKDVLAGLFFGLALWAYAGYARRGGVGRYALVAGAFALGLLAKPMLVTLPCVLLLLDAWPLRRTGRGWGRLVLEKLPLAALAAASVAMTVHAQASGGSVRALASLPLATRLAQAPRAYVEYLVQTFWPHDLAAFYPHPALGRGPAPALGDVATLGALAVLVALTAGAVLLRRRWPAGLVGWLWYLGMLVPVIGVVQVGDQSHADRYTYLPQTGLVLAATWGALALLRARPAARAPLAGGAAAACVALFALARPQVATWRDTLTVFERALEVTDGNYLADVFVGIERRRLGQPDVAERHFRSALDARPDYALAHLHLGQLALARGDAPTARRHLVEAVRISPHLVDAHVGLSALLLGEGDTRAARTALETALRYDPASGLALTNLGALEERLGDDLEAARHYAAAVAAAPALVPPRVNLARLHERRGDAAAAAAVYRAALAELPVDEPGRPGVLRRLAWLLATTSDPAVRAPAEAQRLAEDALRLAPRRGSALLATLAAAQAASGDFAGAVRQQEAALAAAASTEERAELEAHLASYRASRSLSF